MRHNRIRALLLAGCAAAVLGSAGSALAQPAGQVSFDIPAQPLGAALTQFAQQSKREILFPSEVTRNVRAPAVRGDMEPGEALMALLDGSGLTFRTAPTGALVVEVIQGPQGAGAVGGGAEVEALVVTAQKREEAIQDVPIAISAFTQKNLEEQKIEGGFDLLKAIPNVTFSKSNFTSYNFSIRGVGTKAISATTDPGVAVAFNNTALIQNRLFEQEYFDVERVEVLRGPQGTLYGRNATSGVINVISAKPKLAEFEASVKAEVGSFNTRRVSGMINVPLVEDMLAVRVAGALTKRDGYDFNTITQNPVNGRDLWSGRITVGFEPVESIRGNFIWERFTEDDDRSRTSKQLCHRDDGPTHVGSVNLADNAAGQFALRRAVFGQGCKPGSLYDDAAFGTPNGLSFPFIIGPLAVGGFDPIGFFPGGGQGASLFLRRDPYGGMMQSRDMREISSILDPQYRASADLFELNLEFDLTPSLTFSSQSAYNEDQTYSLQDYNRFNSFPIFTDTSELLASNRVDPSAYQYLAPGGVFCDPQIGCSDSLAAFDISQAKGAQFSQEFRLQSSFDGAVNFSAGVNYTKFDTLVDYYVMYNAITAVAHTWPFSQVALGDRPWEGICSSGPYFGSGEERPTTEPSACVYIDPNPADSVNGQGHNYFRSKNPYKLASWAGFGEVYWNVTEAVKVTAGLRYTDDRKTFIPVPSQVLLAPSINLGGLVSIGYPEKPAIEQTWGEFTGRLGVDWKPVLPFTDETLLYAFYSRGYKGGGANPPSPGFATAAEFTAGAEAAGLSPAVIEFYQNSGWLPVIQLTAVNYGPTFDPEFVNAFEVGAKNTLLGGAMTLNLTGFFYDYIDYQVSQIRDRTAVNENFDAKIWGLEFETLFQPSRNLRINANLGLLDTEIADGETSIDVMNRTQGDPNYTLVKPWFQLPSNCVVPTHVAESWATDNSGFGNFWYMCGGLRGALRGYFPYVVPDTETGLPFTFDDYPELAGGAGIVDDIGGNELPNAPHITANIGAQYGMDLFDGSWRATVRADAYWQSQSWSRVYNYDPYDKLHGWYNANLSVWVERPDDGLKIELYVKNLLDATPITDAFLNSDDTGLTTNVFTLDPRLVGLSVRKEF
jgi:iron complex outermembrane receptor protein